MLEQHEVQERPPHEDFPEPMLEPSFTVDETRPAPPKARRAPPPHVEDEEEELEREEARPPRSYGGIIRAAAAFVIVACLAGVVVWQWSNMVALYRVFRAPSTEVVTRDPPPTAQKKDPGRLEPGSSPQETSPAPGAAVAQKVVLYEEDPADPQGKRYVGSALWRTETVSPGPGQPPELAIRADVEVPERKLAMTWSLRRNTDKGLPASHTVEIMFKLPADFPSGGISNVPGILMKQSESDARRAARRAGGQGHQRIFPDRPLGGRRRQGAQSSIAQGARLVRHSGRLQQQPPRHPRHGEGQRPASACSPRRSRCGSSSCGLGRLFARPSSDSSQCATNEQRSERVRRLRVTPPNTHSRRRLCP